MTTNTTSKRQETDIIVGDVHGCGNQLIDTILGNLYGCPPGTADKLRQQASVISGGNTVGKSALVEAQMAAHQGQDCLEGVFVHVNEVQRALAGDGEIPVHKYPRDKDIPRS